MEIELSGPDENAFQLMLFVEKLGSQQRLSVEKKDQIITNMKSGDYKNLLKVFIANFGTVVTLKKNGKLYDVENEE